jgi:hypothetical protein
MWASFFYSKNGNPPQVQWLIPVILASLEKEIERRQQFTSSLGKQ